jgi:hypothetical protein
VAARNRQLNAETKADRDAATRERDNARARKKEADDRAKNVKLAPPRKDLPAPIESDVPMLVLTTSLMANADEAASLARKNKKLLGGDASDLPEKSVPALIEAALDAANQWREFATELTKANRQARGKFLSVVNE